MVSTQAGGTPQADGSDSDLSVFSFLITTPIVGYSGGSEWILDRCVTYHVFPNRDWFSSFEELDGCFVVMDDDHPFSIKGIGTILIKMFNEIV